MSIAIGDIPASWKVARLDDVADLLSGGTPSKLRPEWWQGSIPWASPKDMKRLRLRDTLDHISEEALQSGSRLVPAGTIFVVIRGMILAKELPVAMAEVPMAFNQDMKAVLPRPAADPEYLLYAIASRKGALAREIGTSVHGTRRMGTSSLEELLLPLPPKEEQKVIAAVLSKVQAAIEIQEKVVARLTQLKAATMAKLFREGLTAEPIQATPYGAVPDRWQELSLGQCAFVQTGVAKGRRLNGDEVIKVPYLRVANVQSGRLDLAEMKVIELRRRELRRYLLQDGDVVLTEGGDFDKLGRGFIWRDQVSPCVHQNHIFAVRVDRTRMLPEFLAYLVQSDYGRAYFLTAHKTTNLACINKTKLEAFPVPLPALSEQRELAAHLSAIDVKLATEETRFQALRDLFESLLRQLMTGRVRVTHEMIARERLRERIANRKKWTGVPDERTIHEIVQRIVEVADPEKIVLFGSAARGEMGPDSDLDFLVVKAGVDRRETANVIRRSLIGLAPGLPKDVIVVTPEDIERHRNTIGYIIRPALREGKVVYAA